jgi:OPA family sugar phosphate sensor protein UhpC-like MFS transporter
VTVAPAANGRRRAFQTRAFALTWMAYAAYYLCRKNWGVAKASVEAALGTGIGGVATIETGYNVAYMLGQSASGIAGDKLGAKRLLVVGMVASAACNWWFGVSTAVPVMFAALCLNGVAQSTGWPNTVRSMSEWFGPTSRGRVMGLWSTNYVVGGIAGSALASWLIGWGWRWTYLGPAMALALLALVFGVLHVSRPADVGLTAWDPDPADAPPPWPSPSPSSSPSSSLSPSSSVSRAATRARLLRTPALWAFGAAYFCLKLIRYTMLFWLPYFLTKRLGYEKSAAGFLSVAFEVGGVVGALFAGWLSDRVFGARRVPAAALLALLLAGALFLYIRVAALGPAANFAGMFLVGLCLFGPDSLLAGAAAQDLGGRDGAGTAAGMINGIGSAGQVVQSYLTAWIATAYGWDNLFLLFVVLALGCVAVLLPFWRLGGAAPSRASPQPS